MPDEKKSAKPMSPEETEKFLEAFDGYDEAPREPGQNAVTNSLPPEFTAELDRRAAAARAAKGHPPESK